MKFEDLLPKLREGKIGYIKSAANKSYYTNWIGKENYCIFFFESVDDFRSKYPDAKIADITDTLLRSNSSFLGDWFKSRDSNLYNTPNVFFVNTFFNAEVIVQADWDYFEKE